MRVTIAKNIDAAARVLLDHVEHLHGPKKSDDWALKHDAQGFASGAAAMFMRESWVIPFVKKNGPDVKFGVVPVPRDKAWGAYNNLEILSVNKDSKLKDAAWDFIRILQDQAIVNNVLDGSGWVPIRKDRDYSAVLAKEPRFAEMTTPPQGLTLYIEAPNTAYEEMTTRVGEVIQAGFRDASLAGNIDGAKKVMMRAHDTAVKILKDNGIYQSDAGASNDVAVRGNLAARFQEFRDSIKRDHLLWVLLALGPVFALFCIIRVYPILETIRLSFYRYHPTQRNRPFIGLDNYWRAAGRRGVPHRADQYAAVLRDGGRHHAGAGFRDRGAAAHIEKVAPVYELLLYIPVVTPWVPASVIWKWIFDPIHGILNYGLTFRSACRNSPGCRTSTSSSTPSCWSRCGRCSAISSSCTASACATSRTSCWRPPSSTARRRGSG